MRRPVLGLLVLFFISATLDFPAAAAMTQNEQLERLAIADVVIRERETRDAAQWDRMAEAYFPDTRIGVWFKGSGADFIEASKKIYDSGSRTYHFLGPVTVTLKGNRALAEYNAQVRGHQTINGVEVVATTAIRVYERLEKRQGRWGILLLNCVYQLATVAPFNPNDHLKLDEKKLAAYPPSYRFVAYTLESRGISVPTDLIGVEQDDKVKALVSDNEAWLASGH